jgi:hypothetical protein
MMENLDYFDRYAIDGDTFLRFLKEIEVLYNKR